MSPMFPVRTFRFAVMLAAIIPCPRPAAGGDVERPQGIRYEKYDIPSARCALHLVVFDTAYYTLKVIDNGPSLARPAYASLKDAVRQNGCYAGINGGFFDMQDFTPCGLMIAQGRKVSPFESKTWQEGVFVVRGNQPSLIQREAFTSAEGISDALQSSPWLIRNGKVEEIQKDDVRRTRRVFLVQGKSGIFAIGFSSRATLFEIAGALVSRSLAQTIEVSEVLVLDGATSGGFWYGFKGVVVDDPVQVPVRNFIGVAPIASGVKGAPIPAARAGN